MATRPNIKLLPNVDNDVYALLNAQAGYPQPCLLPWRSYVTRFDIDHVFLSSFNVVLLLVRQKQP